MKKQEVIDLASRRGLCVYEQYKGRKVYYKVRIPVFEDEKEIPTHQSGFVWRHTAFCSCSETDGYGNTVHRSDAHGGRCRV